MTILVQQQMTEADRKQLREICDKATQGDWWIDSHGHRMVSRPRFDTVFEASSSMGPAVRHPETGNLSHWPNDWDATYIVAAQPKVVRGLLDEIERLERERDRLKVDVDALLCDCPDYADVERLCHVLSYLGYSTPTGGEASARWLSLVKDLIGAVETSELLRRDKEAVAEYRQLKAENAELREDKARLDRGYIMIGAPGVNACEHRGIDLRAAIDRVTQLDEQRAQRQAMTKEQP